MEESSQHPKTECQTRVLWAARRCVSSLKGAGHTKRYSLIGFHMPTRGACYASTGAPMKKPRGGCRAARIIPGSTLLGDLCFVFLLLADPGRADGIFAI